MRRVFECPLSRRPRRPCSSVWVPGSDCQRATWRRSRACVSGMPGPMPVTACISQVRTSGPLRLARSLTTPCSASASTRRLPRIRVSACWRSASRASPQVTVTLPYGRPQVTPSPGVCSSAPMVARAAYAHSRASRVGAGPTISWQSWRTCPASTTTMTARCNVSCLTDLWPCCRWPTAASRLSGARRRITHGLS